MNLFLKIRFNKNFLEKKNISIIKSILHQIQELFPLFLKTGTGPKAGSISSICCRGDVSSLLSGTDLRSAAAVAALLSRQSEMKTRHGSVEPAPPSYLRARVWTW